MYENVVLTPILPETLVSLISDKVTESVLKAIKAKEPEPDKLGYITRKQVCQLLHITLPTVHAWINQGKLKSYHVGGRTLFKESEVLDLVKPANEYN